MLAAECASTPRVSVLMSVYNGELFLRKAIESILAQSFVDIELIILDDASTDQTTQIIACYTDRRIIRLKNTENQGLAASLNRCLAVARGDYVARQDADDVSHPERLAQQVAFLNRYPEVGVLGTTSEWIDDQDHVKLVWHQPEDNAGIQETLVRYCCLVHGSVMCRRAAIMEASGYDARLRTGQDYDLWLRVSETWDMACLPDTLYSYRWHERMASKARHVEQAKHAAAARSRALQRRLGYGWLSLGIRPVDPPARLLCMDRHVLAERYTCWSRGAREFSRPVALAYLIFAVLFEPTGLLWRNYARGIVSRKLARQPAGAVKSDTFR